MEQFCATAIVSNVSQLVTFLMTLQSAALNATVNVSTFDPKTYVDLPLRQPLQLTEDAFWSLPRMEDGTLSSETLNAYVGQFFDPAGSDIMPDPPLDYWEQIDGFLPKVMHPEVRQWAVHVHSLWLNLTRSVSYDIQFKQDQHTVLPMPTRFLIAGSRFREPYYWDSYWIIRGLIVSRMINTAQSVVDNLLTLATTYGFVPNGARSYYLNRSQPPLLSEMVKVVFMATGDLSLLERALPILIKEHKFWTSAPHVVNIIDRNGVKHSLTRYHANWNTPRPESSTIDMKLAAEVEASKQAQLYLDIASSAESGWDFSTRWMNDHHNLSTLRTSAIVPVDLNAFVFQMEKNIGLFAKYLGKGVLDKQFSDAALARRGAINAILWNENMGQWFDYWIPMNDCATSRPSFYSWQESNLNKLSFVSNFVPIWTGIVPHDSDGHKQLKHAVKGLDQSGLLQAGGIVTSLTNSGQQWDYPNGWAPMQHMIIEGLSMGSSQRGKAIAEQMAQAWLKSNLVAFKATGAMHEKYDVTKCGGVGAGGEYSPQTGFGWTNGVALDLLNKFGWAADVSTSC